MGDEIGNRRDEEMKLREMYKVGSKCELNSWPNSPVG